MNPGTTPQAEPARAGAFDPVTLVMGTLLGLWACYSLNGFRGWWQPITLSDANEGAAIRQVLFAGSALVSLIVLYARGQVWASLKRQWMLLLMAGWMVLSVGYSDLASRTAKRAILACCGITTAAAVAIACRGSVATLGRWLGVVCSVAGGVSLLWMVAFAPEITTNPGRPGLAGISNHPNTLAPALAIGVVLQLAVPATTRMGGLAKWSGVAACSVALVLTGSVTSMGLGLLALSVYAVLRLPSYWKALAAILVAAAVVGVVFIGVDRLMADSLGAMGRDESMSGRDDLWGAVWETARTKLVFGHGWGAFWTEGKGRELVGTWNPRQSHNAYIDVVLDLGLVGGLIFTLLLGGTAWRLTRQLRTSTESPQAAAALAVLVALLASYAFQQSFLGKVDAFPFIVVLLIAATCSVSRPPERGPVPAASARSTQPGST